MFSIFTFITVKTSFVNGTWYQQKYTVTMHNVHHQLACSHNRCTTLRQNRIKNGDFVYVYREPVWGRNEPGTECTTGDVWLELYGHEWIHVPTKMFFNYLFDEHEKGVKFLLTVGSWKEQKCHKNIQNVRLRRSDSVMDKNCWWCRKGSGQEWCNNTRSPTHNNSWNVNWHW